MTEQHNESTLTLQDLDYFWTKSGVPCFMANRDNIEEIVESLGFNIYYLICNVAEDKKIEDKTWKNGVQSVATTYVTDLKTQIVKVVTNFVGRSVAVVDDEDIYDFTPIRETAVYNLPAIPRDIVDKLDEFFRLVDAQHGTESIVILTFDPNYEDSRGWGVLVPDQTNTSVHCKYEADSIVDQKPDHVMIVGSVHSHPGMAAYASGTDHADQADFDGIHITYGWQKSVNNGATQYHIEMQIGGSSWTLKPEDVFENFTLQKDPDPEVIEWTSKVKKVSPPTGGSASPVAHTPHQQAQSHQPTTTQQVSIQAGTPKGDPRLQECPDPKDEEPYLIIAEVAPDTSGFIQCPSCAAEVAYFLNTPGFHCDTCDIALCLQSDGYTQILSSAAIYLKERNITTNVNYYLWSKDDNDADILMRIGEKDYIADKYDSDHKLIVEEIDPYYYEGFDDEHTVCCNVSLDEIHLCNCSRTIYYEDVLKFDQAHPYSVYNNQSSCIECEYYYSRNCEPYLNSIISYAKTEIPMQKEITPCENFVLYDRSTWSLDDRYA